MSVIRAEMQRILSALAALLLVVDMSPSVFAQESSGENTALVRADFSLDAAQESTQDVDTGDPLARWMMSGIETAAVPTTFENFTPRPTKNETLRRGIDVSAWQGNVDWQAVAADGVEFVIIRAAWKSSSSEKINTDSRFVQYIKGAKAAGLRVGAYIYSQAISVQEAQEEARYLMRVVAPYSIELPLVFDFEYYSDASGNPAGRLWEAQLSRQEATDICNAFCEEVEKHGYKSMVYSNPSMLTKHLYREQLGRLWLAHFISKTTYAGQYEYWQCSCTGQVDGIKGSVDLDFWFQPGGSTVPRPETPTPTRTPTPAATPTARPSHQTPFTDVSTGAWYYKAVMEAYASGIVKGVSAAQFSPNATATRGQVVAMIYRLQDEPETTGSTPFTDLTQAYYRDAVTWAVQLGIAKGMTTTSFGPSYLITREQLVTMLYRLSGSPAAAGSLTSYTDAASVSSYAKNAMIWAVQKGVLNGYGDETLRPRASATRAEVCAILMRFNG